MSSLNSPHFSKTVFSAEIPVNRYGLLCICLDLESIKLITIIEAKMGQNGQNAQLLLKYLRYRDSNQIIIYTDCNRIKGSFD